MGFEERVRLGLKLAELQDDGWVELLALNLIPEPSQWYEGSPLWQFSVPDYLIVSIVTGERRKKRLTFGGPAYAALIDLGIRDSIRVTFFLPRIRGKQQHDIPLGKIRAIEMKFLSPGAIPFRLKWDSLYGPQKRGA